DWSSDVCSSDLTTLTTRTVRHASLFVAGEGGELIKGVEQAYVLHGAFGYEQLPVAVLPHDREHGGGVDRVAVRPLGGGAGRQLEDCAVVVEVVEQVSLDVDVRSGWVGLEPVGDHAFDKGLGMLAGELSVEGGADGFLGQVGLTAGLEEDVGARHDRTLRGAGKAPDPAVFVLEGAVLGGERHDEPCVFAPGHIIG